MTGSLLLEEIILLACNISENKNVSRLLVRFMFELELEYFEVKRNYFEVELEYFEVELEILK